MVATSPHKTRPRPYKPHKKNQIIADRAWEYVQSVPYTVSLRWLFYRLLQDGTYTKKQSYDQMKNLFSGLRKNFHKEWNPETLADETRSADLNGFGALDEDEWLEEVARRKCVLDKWLDQPCYVECWFEAKAMADQFRYYAGEVTLRPFGGDPSIPFKWATATHLREVRRRYGVEKPIKILYFGDLDEKGVSIPMSALADIELWAGAMGVNFEFERVGLNEGDGERLGIEENFEKPGEYQWEALEDKDAKALIRGALEKYLDMDILRATEEREKEITARFGEWIRSAPRGES